MCEAVGGVRQCGVPAVRTYTGTLIYAQHFKLRLILTVQRSDGCRAVRARPKGRKGAQTPHQLMHFTLLVFTFDGTCFENKLCESIN